VLVPVVYTYLARYTKVPALQEGEAAEARPDLDPGPEPRREPVGEGVPAMVTSRTQR